MDDLTEADRAYEAAEAAFIDAVKSGAGRASLAVVAAEVAARADQFNAIAYRRLHDAGTEERTDLDALTERTEVLSELWADLSAAYGATE